MRLFIWTAFFLSALVFSNVQAKDLPDEVTGISLGVTDSSQARFIFLSRGFKVAQPDKTHFVVQGSTRMAGVEWQQVEIGIHNGKVRSLTFSNTYGDAAAMDAARKACAAALQKAYDEHEASAAGGEALRFGQGELFIELHAGGEAGAYRLALEYGCR